MEDKIKIYVKIAPPEYFRNIDAVGFNGSFDMFEIDIPSNDIVMNRIRNEMKVEVEKAIDLFFEQFG